MYIIHYKLILVNVVLWKICISQVFFYNNQIFLPLAVNVLSAVIGVGLLLKLDMIILKTINMESWTEKINFRMLIINKPSFFFFLFFFLSGINSQGIGLKFIKKRATLFCFLFYLLKNRNFIVAIYIFFINLKIIILD